MNNPFYYEKIYKLKNTKQDFISKLNQVTTKKSKTFIKKNNHYTFTGTVFDDRFEIQSIPPSVRKYYLLNPIIYGNFNNNNNTTELLIKIKFKSFKFVIFLLSIIGTFFTVMTCIYNNSNTVILEFSLLIILISLLLVVFLFIAKLNICDAIYSFENFYNRVGQRWYS